VCTALTLQPGLRWPVLRNVGDGCGNSLGLQYECSTAGSSWVCGGNNVCVGWTELPEAELQTTRANSAVAGPVGDGAWHLGCAATCANANALRAVTPNVCEPCGGLCLNRVHCRVRPPPAQRHGVRPRCSNQLYNVIVSIPNLPVRHSLRSYGCYLHLSDGQVSGQPCHRG